ncbi:hypothetical protein EG329_000438 [Mollisiaceae sp. DMI_Dod_QoI]|nr:hypothetical protein EG329_000438 [Helotiales sp. DMI_Dod_QoI]
MDMGDTSKALDNPMNRDPQSRLDEPRAKVRVRAGHTKANGGCTTCKARHVRCDETKPACLRCLKFWGHCDGYTPPKRRARSRSSFVFVKSSSQPLLPRATSVSLSPIQDTLITSTPFKCAYEHQGFQNFLAQNVLQLPGLFSNPLWDRIILQASAIEPFVRDTLVAIGALTSCGRKWTDDLSIGKKSTTGIEVTPQYHFALQHYGNAVKAMRKTLHSYANEYGKSFGQGKRGHNLRMMLIACLLVTCFEGLQGNHFLALQHAASGHSVLQDWLSQHQPLESAYSSPLQNSSMSATIDANSTVQMQGLGSPLPQIIEDEIIQAFSRLDLQIMTYVDPRPLSVHSKLKHEGSHAIACMPYPFDSLEQARLYWELIQRRTSHFIADAAAQTSLRQDADMTIDMGLGNGSVLVAPESEVKLNTSHFPPVLVAEYHSYASEISRWFASFLPFYGSLTEGSRNWAASSILRIQALSHQILLHGSILSDEWSLDSFTSVFSEIVSLGHLVAKDPLYSTPNLFSFDVGLVNSIRCVSKWCREPVIRRSSIALLRKIANREGIWDALIMANVSEWMMEIEEEKMILISDPESGHEEKWFIRKDDRVRTTNIVIDNVKRTAAVTCKRLGRKEDGSVDERGTAIRW